MWVLGLSVFVKCFQESIFIQFHLNYCSVLSNHYFLAADINGFTLLLTESFRGPVFPNRVFLKCSMLSLFGAFHV